MDKYDSLLLKNHLCFPTYAVSNLDLTYTQYIVMMVMWEKKIVNEKDLCQELRLETNTLTPVLQRLKKKNYILIEKSNEDKRNIIITLTDEGNKLKDLAIDVPPSIAEEFNLTTEEAIFMYKILYKILDYDKDKK